MSNLYSIIRYSQRLALSLLFLIGSASNVSATSLSILTPSTLFLQAGIAEQHTQTYAAGATWDGRWRRKYSFGTISGYSEASFGRWITDVGKGGSAWETQIGLTPVVRWHPGNERLQNWFVEIGIGANLILPIYRSESKTFSTEFNFGDHLAIGKQFGAHGRHELALRVQHFSNGGIDHLNPGENFIQLRYSRRL